MEKPMILQMEDMNNELSEVVNKYVNKIPANIIADSLNRLITQLNQIYQQQVEIAKKAYEGNKEETKDEKVN